MNTVVGIIIVLGTIGCAELQSVERGRVNHRAFDLSKEKTRPQSLYLTNLNSIQSSSSGGTCSVCVH